MSQPSGERDDLALLLAARNGDDEAGEILVRRFGASMIRTAWSVMGRYSASEAEDVVQEGFIAALTTAALPQGDVGAWLRSITARKALDGLRQRKRRVEDPLEVIGDAQGEPAASGGLGVPLDVLGVRQALARLSAIDRAVLVLVDLEGFSMAEAANAIGSTTMAVKWRAVRARRKLRVILEGSDDND